MAKAKTIQTENSVTDFIKSLPDEQKQQDSFAVAELMEKHSGFEAKMWGPAIIGFGSYHYKYESGHEGDAPLIAFSPRKAELVLYLSSKFDQRDELLSMFGKHRTSKACIYVKKLKDINPEVLEEMIRNSIRYSKNNTSNCA